MKILSFDIGGSKIAYAQVDENGTILSKTKIISTPKTAAEITNFLQAAVWQNKSDAFAVATAGVVFNNRLKEKPNNLPEGYENISWQQIFPAPYVVENDANSAAWAEYKIGCLRNTRNALMLTLGTDVGCGIICNSQILHGKCGAAGEVEFDCSGSSLRRIAEKLGLKENDCFILYEKAKQKNGPEREAYKIWQNNLLESIMLLNRVLDTEVVAVSGSLAKIVDYAVINTSLKIIQPHNAPLVKPAACGTNAGLIGAALLCAQKLNSRP